MRRERRVLLAAALIGLLSGCAGIPTSGPVIPSDVDRSDQVDAPAPYVPRAVRSPEPGADPVEIVEGFLAASVSYASDATTVREYLTPAAARSWEPSDQVTVTVKRPEVEATADGLGVRLSYSAIATTDASGAYSEVARDDRTTSEVRLKLSRVNGEWRIAKPPDGVIMSVSDFDLEFAPHYRYFFDPTFTVMVPEPIYLPRGGNTETLLAKALVSGPSAWLEPAVATAFPDSTKLAVASVPVTDGTAQVELSFDDSPVGTEKREQMAAQLAWTLTSAEVAEIEATVDGGPLLAGEPIRRSDFQANAYTSGRDSQLYLLDQQRDLVATVSDGGQAERVAGPFGRSMDIAEFAVDPDGSQIVAISQDRRQVLHAATDQGADLETIAVGTNLASLAWDRTGRIWMLEDDGAGAELRATRSDGDTETIAVRQRVAGDIEAIAVSPDGIKMGMVIDGTAYAGVIVPNTDGADITNLEPVDLPGTVLDIAWSDATTVAVLAEESNEDPEVSLIEVASREVTGLGSLPTTADGDASAIAAASLEQVIVGTSVDASSPDQLWANDGPGQWSLLGDGTAPAFPG